MRRRTLVSATLAAVAILALLTTISSFATNDVKLDAKLEKALTVIDEFKAPGLEAELSGIFPHPTNSDLYYVLANQKPPYRHGQIPMLAPEHRGKLLTINRKGDVLNSVTLANDDFGGLAFANGYLFAALTDGASLLKVDPDNGEVVDEIPLSSPAGGLAFDPDRGALIAQLYVGHPHLAVIDPETGTITETLWSDESAMGLAKVDGDWLCTWASGWDPGSFSELRVLDQKTGKVRSRVHLEGIHTSMAPTGGDTFISLVTTDSASGETVIRKYGYVGEANWAQM